MFKFLLMFIKLLAQSVFFVPRTQSFFYQLFLPVLTALILLFLKIWIPDIGRNAPFLLFMTAIVLNGWFVGFIASVMLTVFSALLVSFVLITPFGILNQYPISSVEAGIFIIECFFLCFLVEVVKKTLDEISLDKKLLEVILAATVTYGVILLDETYTIVGWSKGAQNIFGYTREEIIGKHLSHICDKKNWFHRNTEPLRVRVKTHHIYSPFAKQRVCMKIITVAHKKPLLSVPENISSSSLSSQLTGTLN